jgi:YVTN family beta-propeller protein
VSENHVEYNQSGGIVFHTHVSGSTVNGNNIVHNWLIGNKADNGETTVSTGINVGANASPITNTVIANNLIGYEALGINIQDNAGVTLSGNWINPNVNIPVQKQKMPVTAQSFLTKVGTIQLPGKGGHGDVVAYDPAEKAMYVAQSPDNNVIVISTVTRQIVKVIPDMASSNGIAIGPKYIYVANAASNSVAVIEKGSWKVVATVSSGGKTPDAIYYDGKDNKVLVANDDTNNMGVINANTFKLETTYPLLPKNATSGPDLGVLVTNQNRLYQADDNYIDVINPTANKIVQQLSTTLPSSKATKDMIYDPATNQVWVGTTGNEVIALNPTSGKMSSVATASGQDQIAWDPASKMLFTGSKNGTMEVINMTTKQSIGSIPTESGFHTLDVDTDNHIVYAYLNDSNQIDLYQENMWLLNGSVPSSQAQKPEVTAQSFLTQKTGEISLPGKGGHGDVVAYDPAEKAMYIAQSPDNNVIVVNTVTQQIEKVIPNMPSSNGIAVGPKYIYVANANSNSVAVIEKGTWNVVATVSSGGKTPDAIYYDGSDNKVFVANDDTNNMAVINATTFKLETTFPLLPKNATSGPDLGVLVADKHQLYQADDNYIDVIDTRSDKLVKQLKTNLPSSKATKDMIYDPSTRTVWVGTTGNEVITLNVDTEQMTSVATASGMDQIAWDPASKMLFTGSKNGTIEVIDMTTKKSIGAVPTESGFHTLDVDTDTHVVYAYYNDSNKIVLFQENMGSLK